MTLKDINLDKRTEKYTYPYLYRSIGWEGAKNLRKGECFELDPVEGKGASKVLAII